MFTLKVENLQGDILTLTNNETDYQVVEVSGLNPPQAILNSAVVSGMDGSKFKSARLEERNIVITLRLNSQVEKNRIFLYKYFKTKQWCKIYYNNSSRNVYIEGYVESIDCNLFSISELMQISIVCHDPYFRDIDEIVADMSKLIYNFEFPFAFGANGATQDGVNIVESPTDDAKEFSIYSHSNETEIINDSEVDTGLVIEIEFRGITDDPKIMNTFTGEFFQVSGTYDIGDKIIIDTNRGRKSVKLIRNGIENNLMSQLVFGSTWLPLRIGINTFSNAASDGDMFMRVIYRHNNLYEGV